VTNKKETIFNDRKTPRKNNCFEDRYGSFSLFKGLLAKKLFFFNCLKKIVMLFQWKFEKLILFSDLKWKKTLTETTLRKKIFSKILNFLGE